MTNMTEPTLSAPLGAATAGRLAFTHGVANLTLTVDRSMTELYRARIMGRPPEISVHGGSVEITYPHRVSNLGLGRASIDVVLNPSIPWEISIRGGASNISADLRHLKLTQFNVDGGVSRGELTLGEATGEVPVWVSGGVSRLSVHRPATAPARLEIKGGTSKLNFDDTTWGAMGGPSRLHSPGYSTSAGRYDVRIGSGASRIDLDTY